MISKEDIRKSFEFRHACKVFDENKKVSLEDMKFIMDITRLSPSSFGFEPFKFLVIEGEKKLRFLEDTWGGKGQIPTCSYLVIALAKTINLMRYDTDYIKYMMEDVQKLPEDIIKLKRDKFKAFQENEFKLLESDRAIIDWAGKQIYISLGNMMSIAAMLGIDSCPLEGFFPKKIIEILEKDFNIEKKDYYPSVMVAFGYRKNEQQVRTRAFNEDIISWIK